ncbi:MAG: phage minor capsid protein [Ruminococcus sp.]|nr:phage minor capsid protein [Ruminococcus sp.]
MLDPTYLDGCADDIVDIFIETEREILNDVVRRIIKNNGLSDTARWQIQKSKAIGLLNGDLKKYLSAALQDASVDVDEVFRDASVKAIAADDAIYALNGVKPVSVLESDNMKSIILQGTKETKLLLRNFTKTTANVADMSLYNSLDKAYLLTQIGAYDYNSAIRKAVNELASLGMTKVAYPSGHVDKTDVAVRRAVLTGLNQTCGNLQLYRADDVGCDLVEVTAHMGARPSHALWQGKIYSLSGKTRGYDNFYDATGYGTGDGLCGWNCRHSFFPYYEGISGRTFTAFTTRESIKENEKIYELTQKQRYYERRIRAAKTECVALNQAVLSATDDQQEKMFREDFASASVKLKRREAALKAFISQNPILNRQPEREWKSGFNRSVSAKAVWANRKSK